MSEAPVAAQKRAEIDNPPKTGVLLSIHFTSNRPDNFTRFLDRLEAATDDLSSVEVVVKIDDNDLDMNRVLQQEAARRLFRITYISTPLSGGFYGLWSCYDDLFKACDPNAYFLLPLNDEMHFANKGWDTTLRKYVGLHPDHIFRLRTSHHRLRTYYDFWEPGWSNDTSSFVTRRWIELGGGWCPCNGPDSFQQCVAYYFGWLRRFDVARPYREQPIYDISFGGAGDSIGLSGQALRQRMRGALKPWFILMSHRMQQEAARRAQILHAHIWAEAHPTLEQFEVRDNRRRHRIEVVDLLSTYTVDSHSYRLSWLRITLTNAFRKLNYGYYGGAGDTFRDRRLYNFIEYLCLRHGKLDYLRRSYRKLRSVAASRLGPLRQPVAKIVSWRIYRPSLILKGLADPKRALRRIRLLFSDLP